MATATTGVKRKLGRHPKVWQEPEGYRRGLLSHVQDLENIADAVTTSNGVLAITHSKRADREGMGIRSITGEVLSVLARYGCTDCPMWPAAYVPCGPNGRALFYKSEAEMKVLRSLLNDFRPKILVLLKRGKCVVAGLNAARLLAGFPELRPYVVGNDAESEAGSGPSCVPYPSEWYKLHGDGLIPLYQKLAGIFGDGFPDMDVFERQINAAYRRVRISVHIWVHANLPPEKKANWRKHIAEAMKNPETIAKLSEASKKKYVDRPELREQFGEQIKNIWATRREEQRELITEAMSRADVKDKQCSGIAKKWEDKEWSDKRRKDLSTQGIKRAAAMKTTEERMPDSYHRAKSDAISKAKRHKNVKEGKEISPDVPKAMRLHVPLKLTDAQLEEVLVLLRKRHAECCLDPQDKYVFWAICPDGNLRRGSRAVRTLLDKFDVKRQDLPGDWQSIHEPSSMPSESQSSASSAAAR